MTTPKQPTTGNNQQTSLISSEEVSASGKNLRAGIDSRFLEEVDKILAGGYAESVINLSTQLGIGRNYISQVRVRRFHVKLAHIRRLKDVYNADYHYILFGVPHPEVKKRGLRKPAGKPSGSLSIDDLQAWIDYRFIKEVERVEREGRVHNRQWLAEKIGANRFVFLRIRTSKAHVLPEHLVLFKQNLNADYHFILWGVERKDISGASIMTTSGRMRLDVYDKVLNYGYLQAANWAACIPPRREEDETRRYETAYYLDVPSL